MSLAKEAVTPVEAFIAYQAVTKGVPLAVYAARKAKGKVDEKIDEVKHRKTVEELDKIIAQKEGKKTASLAKEAAIDAYGLEKEAIGAKGLSRVASGLLLLGAGTEVDKLREAAQAPITEHQETVQREGGSSVGGVRYTGAKKRHESEGRKKVLKAVRAPDVGPPTRTQKDVVDFAQRISRPRRAMFNTLIDKYSPQTRDQRAETYRARKAKNTPVLRQSTVRR